MAKEKKGLFKSLFNRTNKSEKINRLMDDKHHFGLAELDTQHNRASNINYEYGDDISGLHTGALISTAGNKARTRLEIYQTWQKMEKDPVVSTALKAHVVAALGGHESKGDLIFIEDNANASDEDKKIIDELRVDLLDIFNRIAVTVAYNGIAFGDSYARTYYEKGKGLVHCFSDELTHPILILPYEQGGNTVGFLAGTTQNNLARLTTLQLARMKMPRDVWIPQMGVIAKSYRHQITIDNLDKLPKVPSLIGGSFLFAAEKPFRDFYISLGSMVGQRLVDAIDESLVTVNMTGSNEDQRRRFKQSMERILRKSKEMADSAMEGEPFYGRVRHVVYTHQEKQLTTHGEPLKSQRTGSTTIDDVMIHARLLAGSLGIDLAMLGFADQLSGGLGDGGFFRMSAQVAEKSRLIRVGLSDFFETIIDNHMLFKYGKKWERANRPYGINFYGSISAFESEKQKTRAEAVGAAGLMTQTFEQLKGLGLSEKEITLFMTKQMLLDNDEAELYAKALVSSQAEMGMEE